ncbi:MAG: ATPase [Actinobacteria bacterium]|nr:ATPase [Actinomycetota bacterium]
MSVALQEINQKVQQESACIQEIISEAGKVIVGQQYIVDRLLIGILTGGHLLLEGVPGLAKTLAIKTLADIVDVNFQRIQFTPDLLPSDVIGTMIYNQAKQEFVPKLGPVFANFILADEINRAPAKVQSALLEAMQERQVTIGDTSYALKAPFLVLATQNPIDQEGTYRLPEAQVDRFLLKLSVSYPSKEDEKIIIDRMSQPKIPSVNKVLKASDIERLQNVVYDVYVDDKIKEYILDIVMATRTPEKYQLKALSPMIAFGASPRASLGLIHAAKAHAFLQQRGFVTPEDVKAVGQDVLRHRVIPSFEAEAEEMQAEDIIQKIFDEIEVP